MSIKGDILIVVVSRARIRIGDTKFLFLLPRMMNMDIPEPQQYINTSSQDESSSNKDDKPPYSYATLIAQAITSTDDKRMALHEIYNYITHHYPYYNMAQNGWQVSLYYTLLYSMMFIVCIELDSTQSFS